MLTQPQTNYSIKGLIILFNFHKKSLFFFLISIYYMIHVNYKKKILNVNFAKGNSSIQVAK